MEAPMRESVGWDASAVYRQRLPPDDTKYATVDKPKRGSSARRRRYVMKKFIAAIALFTIITIPTLSTSVNAATVSPSSSEFGSNGY
jgi:hypothetical protein